MRPLPLPEAIGELSVLLADEWPPKHLEGAPWQELHALFDDVMGEAPDVLLPAFALRSPEAFEGWREACRPYALMGWFAGSYAAAGTAPADLPAASVSVGADDLQALLAEHGIVGLCRQAGFDANQALGTVRELLLATTANQIVEAELGDIEAAAEYADDLLAVMPTWVLFWMLLGAQTAGAGS